MKEKVLMNWSGGKDSAMALYNILRNKDYQVEGLLTSVNASNQRISMHGVSGSLLVKQAESIGLPLTTINLPESSSSDRRIIFSMCFLRKSDIIKFRLTDPKRFF